MTRAVSAPLRSTRRDARVAPLPLAWGRVWHFLACRPCTVAHQGFETVSCRQQAGVATPRGRLHPNARNPEIRSVQSPEQYSQLTASTQDEGTAHGLAPLIARASSASTSLTFPTAPFHHPFHTAIPSCAASAVLRAPPRSGAWRSRSRAGVRRNFATLSLEISYRLTRDD